MYNDFPRTVSLLIIDRSVESLPTSSDQPRGASGEYICLLVLDTRLTEALLDFFSSPEIMSGIVDLVSELETRELGQQVIDTVCSHFSELLLFPGF